MRLRRVVLPDGSVLEQCQESAPSPASEPFCTLVPSAEIIRLTSENAKLKSENERIPALELELEETTAQLGENQAALEASIEEIKRLQASSKVREDCCRLSWRITAARFRACRVL